MKKIYIIAEISEPIMINISEDIIRWCYCQ